LVYNNRIGDCSKLQKQKVARDYLKYGKKPANEFWRNKDCLRSTDFTAEAKLYFGIGFEEMHRETKILENWLPFKTEFPLIYNNINRNQALDKYNIQRPDLYNFGFAHNNCYARCIKAGQGHFKLLRDQIVCCLIN